MNDTTDPNALSDEINSEMMNSSVLSGDKKRPADLKRVYDVPVRVSAVLGRSKIEISELLALKAGTVLQLDRQVGDAVDVLVNNRLIARGEVVMIENRIGITMTEIFKQDDEAR